MTKDEIFELYKKEREYQEKCFGEYKDNPSLNVGSFLIFMENYLNRAKLSYMTNWTPKPNSWLITSTELIKQGSCPEETYEEIIKIFAFAGACLESYCKIDLEKWRKNDE